MMATKRGKFHMKVHQVDGSKKLNILQLMKFCIKAGVNLYFVTYKLLQRNEIKNDHKINIVIKSSDGYIIQGCWIKTHDSWVARVRKSSIKKDISNTSEVITHTAVRAVGLHLLGIFKTWEDCALGKTKRAALGRRSHNLGRESVFLYQLIINFHCWR